MDAVELLKGFADPTRLRVLHLLANRGPEICVCDLVATLQVPQGTVSRHLMQLRHQGIVRDRRQGVWMHYSLSPAASPPHTALLECLRGCFDEEPVLRGDLARFDAGRESEAPDCCPAGEPAAFQPDPEQKPAKTGTP